MTTGWWAEGLLFENCACTLVCPGHMHFSQLCTHERCKGYWALRFDEGSFGGVPLAGLRAVLAFDTPQRMIDGHWMQSIIIDESATPEQRKARIAVLGVARCKPVHRQSAVPSRTDFIDDPPFPEFAR